MYQLLALFTGVTLAIMISINGTLAECFDAFTAAAIIHLVGSVSALLLLIPKKERRPLPAGAPWWIYLGGAVGVLTTLSQNFAFSKISMTSLVALGLFGQTVASLLIDRFGLFGMERHPFKKSSLIGLAFALAGMISMLDASVASAALAVLASLGGGMCVVVSRTFNSRLARDTSPLVSSAAAHITGLFITVVLAFLLAGGAAFSPVAPGAERPWIYIGGIMGVAVIILCNLTVPRVSAFRLTLLTFVGQIFAGIGLDVLTGKTYSDATFTGGLIIAAGIAVNMVTDALLAKRLSKS